MKKYVQIKELGESVVKPELIEEWRTFCDFLCHKEGLREVSVEVIEDLISTMKFLKETDMKAKDIVEKVGRSWNSIIDSNVMVNAVERFSLKGAEFKEDLLEAQRKNSCKTLDDILKTKR